jgi:hypothetical protein
LIKNGKEQNVKDELTPCKFAIGLLT